MKPVGWTIWDDTAPHVDENGNEIWPDGTPWRPREEMERYSEEGYTFRRCPECGCTYPNDNEICQHCEEEDDCQYCGRSENGYGTDGRFCHRHADK